MDALPSDTASRAAERETDRTRRHGIGAAWLVACIAHDAFQDGDVEWLMEIAARRRGELPDDCG